MPERYNANKTYITKDNAKLIATARDFANEIPEADIKALITKYTQQIQKVEQRFINSNQPFVPDSMRAYQLLSKKAILSALLERVQNPANNT